MRAREDAVSLTNLAQAVLLAPLRQREPEAVMAGGEAQAYEDLMARHGRLFQGRFAKRIARELRRNARVLDVGAGTGWLAVDLTLRRPDVTVWALDPSNEMLERARRRTESAGVGERVRFAVGVAEALPFERAAFDAVYSNYALHHLDESQALLDDAARVARPGAAVLVRDLRRLRAWQARALIASARVVLGYDSMQARIGRESLAAALSLAEAKHAAASCRLSGATAKACEGWHLIIEGRAGSSV